MHVCSGHFNELRLASDEKNETWTRGKHGKRRANIGQLPPLACRPFIRWPRHRPLLRRRRRCGLMFLIIVGGSFPSFPPPQFVRRNLLPLITAKNPRPRALKPTYMYLRGLLYALTNDYLLWMEPLHYIHFLSCQQVLDPSFLDNNSILDGPKIWKSCIPSILIEHQLSQLLKPTS